MVGKTNGKFYYSIESGFNKKKYLKKIFKKNI